MKYKHENVIHWGVSVLRLAGLGVVLAFTAFGQTATTSSAMDSQAQAVTSYCEDQSALQPQDTYAGDSDPAVLLPMVCCYDDDYCLPSGAVEPLTPDECLSIPDTESQDCIGSESSQDPWISEQPPSSCNTDDCLIVPYPDSMPDVQAVDTDINEPPQLR